MDMENVLKSYEHFNERDKSAKIWVIGTDYANLPKEFNRLRYNTFITNWDYSRDNINSINRLWSEFVGMWYVYKNNIKSDYVGFCHYRRLIKLPKGYKDLLMTRKFIYFYEGFRRVNHSVKYKHKDDVLLEYFLNDFDCPTVVYDDLYKYLKTQKLLDFKKIAHTCAFETVYWPRCCIFFTRWDNFVKMMEFLCGYFDFIKAKYNIKSAEDWFKHVEEVIISHYKASKSPKRFCYGSQEEFKRLWDKDKGLSRRCNPWRCYSYIVEILIGIYLMTVGSQKVN